MVRIRVFASSFAGLRQTSRSTDPEVYFFIPFFPRYALEKKESWCKNWLARVLREKGSLVYTGLHFLLRWATADRPLDGTGGLYLIPLFLAALWKKGFLLRELARLWREAGLLLNSVQVNRYARSPSWRNDPLLN